jgi:hypothetical protein
VWVSVSDVFNHELEVIRGILADLQQQQQQQQQLLQEQQQRRQQRQQ